jgi:phenylalanyl-tRNA synthetase beta chain
MIFSYNWLKDYVKGLPMPEKLAELLTLHFAEVENIKKIRSDYAISLDVRPNRAADCFSHLGIAREISAITNTKFDLPQTKYQGFAGTRTVDFVKVEVKDKRSCPRYMIKAVTDVKVAPSPKWIQDKLKTCGLRPINNVVDIANFVMLETGQPLHTFDGEKLKGKKIKVRSAKKEESMVTLDENKFDLDQSVLVIADESDPVAIAGIKGGMGPGIDKKTRVVLIEAANFNSHAVRKTSRKLGLRTDASLRFEHGIDPNLAEFALNRTAYLLWKVAKGKVSNDVIDIYPQKNFPLRIKLDFDYLDNLLGLFIPKIKVIQILKKLNFRILKQNSKSVLVEVPTQRVDVSFPEDLIEEVGRIYGYQKIQAKFPEFSLAPGKRNSNLFWSNRIKDIMKETGFSEIFGYSFLSESDVKNFNYNIEDLIEVQNPISSEQKYLRPSLIPGLLKAVQRNVNNFQEIKIFESGKIFEKAMASKDKKQLVAASFKSDFYEIKGIVDFLLNKIGIKDFSYIDYKPGEKENNNPIFHPKKTAEIKIKEKSIGFLGEISLKALQQMEIPGGVAIFNIDEDALINSISGETEFIPISKFPSLIRDLALLVPLKTKVFDVENKINNAGSGLIKEIDLFDIYQGEELPKDKKNLAFHIVYQAKDRTLKSEEVDKVHQKVIRSLENNLDWKVRK